MNNRRAFSLVEVIVALTIFSAGVLGIIAGLSMSVESGERSSRLVQAARIAERKIELAIHVPSSQMAEQSGEEGAYQWVLTYSSKSQNLKRASILVQWMEKDKPREITMTRLFLTRQEQTVDTGG